MEKKIVIAGGTGFIGSYLATKFGGEGYRVLIISRDKTHINWESEEEIRLALEGTEMVVNLAGKSVNCRYNEKNKRMIFGSRVNTTKKLQELISGCSTPPPLWINASTATIYRHAEDRPMDEETGEIGQGFSVSVARAWEHALFEKSLTGTRKVALRTAIVLGRKGGALQPYKMLTRLGLGGIQGDGKQMFSWIQLEDFYRIIKFISSHPSLSGVINASSPHPVSNREFMAEMRKRIGPLFHFRTPVWILKVGAMMIGTDTELILKSRWVIPKRLTEAGFRFKYGNLGGALDEVLL